MGEQFVRENRLKTVVYMILMRQGNCDCPEQILLQRRQNTGYMDGKFDFSASGHLDRNEPLSEGAIREAREELGIEIKEEDAEFRLLLDGNADGYLKVFFVTSVWEGEPRINEPDKCSQLQWFYVDELPEDMIPFMKEAYAMIQQRKYYYNCGAF